MWEAEFGRLDERTCEILPTKKRGLWERHKKCQKRDFKRKHRSFKVLIVTRISQELSPVITTWMNEHTVKVFVSTSAPSIENDNPDCHLCGPTSPLLPLQESGNPNFPQHSSPHCSLSASSSLSKGGLFRVGLAHRYNSGVNTHSSVVQMAAFCWRGDWIRARCWLLGTLINAACCAPMRHGTQGPAAECQWDAMYGNNMNMNNTLRKMHVSY